MITAAKVADKKLCGMLKLLLKYYLIITKLLRLHNFLKCFRTFASKKQTWLNVSNSSIY